MLYDSTLLSFLMVSKKQRCNPWAGLTDYMMRTGRGKINNRNRYHIGERNNEECD
jgi:hypothetical protein